MLALLVLVTADWTDERTYSAEALEGAQLWRVLEAYDGDLSLPRVCLFLPCFHYEGLFFPSILHSLLPKA